MTAEPSRPHARETLPAWSLSSAAAAKIGIANPLPERVDREWAFGGATGAGRQGLHPRQRRRSGASARRRSRRRGRRSRSARTASRSPRRTSRATSAGTAPRAPGSSARSPPPRSLLRARARRRLQGIGKILLAGLRWAIEQGYDVINMSLSTTKRELGDLLHELADTAYFRRTVLVASAHNMPVESFPWRFSSVISVGSHEEDDPLALLRQPRPAGRVLRARSRRGGRMARRRHDPRLGQQLRHAVHHGIASLDPEQAPGPHPVPAEDGAAPDLEERPLRRCLIASTPPSRQA